MCSGRWSETSLWQRKSWGVDSLRVYQLSITLATKAHSLSPCLCCWWTPIQWSPYGDWKITEKISQSHRTIDRSTDLIFLKRSVQTDNSWPERCGQVEACGLSAELTQVRESNLEKSLNQTSACKAVFSAGMTLRQASVQSLLKTSGRSSEGH